jgi:hypothetical protein
MAHVLDTDTEFLGLLGRPVWTEFGRGHISQAFGDSEGLRTVIVWINEVVWIAALAEDVEFLPLN